MSSTADTQHPTLTRLTGRRVVASDDAGDVGTVKHVVLSDDGRRITGLHVAGGKRNAALVEWSDVNSVGPDAVMIAGAGALREPRDEADEAFVRENIEPIGTQVLDTDGFRIGKIVDMTLDTDSGRVREAITDSPVIPADRFRSIGTYALVVDAG